MDGSTPPTSAKFLFAKFYSPAQINSDGDLHEVSQQLSSTQQLGQAASAAFIHQLVSSIFNEGHLKGFSSSLHQLHFTNSRGKTGTEQSGAAGKPHIRIEILGVGSEASL